MTNDAKQVTAPIFEKRWMDYVAWFLPMLLIILIPTYEGIPRWASLLSFIVGFGWLMFMIMLAALARSKLPTKSKESAD